MTSSYKPIGNYIGQVKTRNKELSHGEPKGININKIFMPSVANTTGTDLSKYRVVNKNQFAYNPMHVGRDGVLPIAMLEQDEAVIVSPAYVVFEVIDHEKLLPDYLMMWCRRPEFDRNAWFTTDSSVRGGFNWDDLCAMELPVPDIEIQREIVREYNVIVDRIKLNEQLCAKLEEAAQALYKHWFVDFEFPISADYASSIGKPELEGRPYKSSGGEMKYCTDLTIDIPKEWHSRPFTEVLLLRGGGTPKTVVQEYWGGDIPFFTGKDVFSSYYTIETIRNLTELGIKNCSSKLYPKNTTFIICRGATTGAISLSSSEMAMNQSCYAFNSPTSQEYYAHQLCLYTIKRLKEEALGSTFEALVTSDFDATIVAEAKEVLQKHFNKCAFPIYAEILLKQKEVGALRDMISTILAKMAVKPLEEVA